MGRLTAKQVRHLLERPAASQPMVGRLPNLNQDAAGKLQRASLLSLSLSPSAPSTPFAETKARALDVASKKVELGTLQREATGAFQEPRELNEDKPDDFSARRTRVSGRSLPPPASLRARPP